MEVSIIIINYNTSAFTIRCIQSIYQFTKNLRFEIILVDNASTENGHINFRELFPEIVLVRNPINEGFAKGNNRGIQQAKGEVILLLNNDTEIRDGAIESAYQILKENSHISVVTGKLIFPDGQIQHQCGRFPSVALQLIELIRIQKILSKRVRESLLLGGFFDHNSPIYPDWIWGTFFMFNRNVLNIFPDGKLSETYFMYMEDMEWCYRIRKFGLKIFYDPSISIVHYSRASSSSFFGATLNPLILENFKHLLNRERGWLYAKLFFFLGKLIKISALRNWQVTKR